MSAELNYLKLIKCSSSLFFILKYREIEVKGIPNILGQLSFSL